MLGSTDEFAGKLLGWYDIHRREMPWRVVKEAAGTYPDPYYVLVSEAMLQQTQVATATGYFVRFIAQLPTIQSLASADEQTVLRLWQGLGYYARARNLHRTARAIVERHAGEVPDDVDRLLALPGIGPYTAGAIASLAFNRRVPLVDGNVVRVLCRLDCVSGNPRTPAVSKAIWQRAGGLVPLDRPADFNSALMELGATVCMPRAPACLICPVRDHCAAREAGLQLEIPPARPAKATPIERRWTFCIRHRGRWLLEQRPADGRWASMWQFITIASPQATDPATVADDRAAQLVKLPVHDVKRLLTLKHALTHRRYCFTAYTCILKTARRQLPANQRWLTMAQINTFPLPRPHLRILAQLPNP